MTQGEALQGVPAPAEAKLYGPGQYTTSVSPSQPSWYSFRVGAGQSIAISATLPDSDAGIPSVFKTELQDESLEFADSDAATNGDDVLTAVVKATWGGGPAQAARGALVLQARGRSGPGAERPVPDRAVRAGDRQGDRGAGGVVGSMRLGGGRHEGGDDDGPSDGVLLAGALGGIVAGLLAGGALAGVRRRRPA